MNQPIMFWCCVCMDYIANNKGSVIFILYCHKGKGKGKAIPLHAWTGL